MKKQNIKLSIALAAVFSSSVALAEVEVTGKIVHETASFIQGGIGIGAATTATQTADSHGKDIFKTETSAKIYIDGTSDEIAGGLAYHVELNPFVDPEGVTSYDGNESYTQRDALREAYVDAEVSDVSLRVGKQQVVWGTADGMKLLDAINPTDYSEMAQNQMEDSRIPVWMVNAEKTLDNGGTVQLVVSEAKGSVIAGLGNASSSKAMHTNGDAGNAFIMKGVDSITGKVHGMMNIGPALGKVARTFAAYPGSDGTITTGASALRTYTRTRVKDFVNDHSVKDATDYNGGSGGTWSEGDFRGLCATKGSASHCEAADLAVVANGVGTTWLNSYSKVIAAGQNNYVTNLINETNDEWGVGDGTAKRDSMFEYMDETAFGTFSAFVNMESEYRVVDDTAANVALRYQGSTPSGVNYSLNFLHGKDTNPYIDVGWEDANTGVKLYPNETTEARNGQSITTVRMWTGAEGTGTEHKVENTASSSVGGPAKFVFTERHADIQQFGGSFDAAVETSQLGPVVLRGEVLFQKDVMTPIFDSAKLRIGNASAAFTNQKSNFFKYVLGADITALTNMMISAQFIQIRNLDYVNQLVQANSDNATTKGWRYTADTAAMHLTNGMLKAEENKEFYSLFFSKPFGASGEHRWNNITMYEENGGVWNRLDAEFSITDDTQVTAEVNSYFGNVNTQFGQLEKSSNIQLGFKYSF
jgi:hypothetical protein